MIGSLCKWQIINGLQQINRKTQQQMMPLLMSFLLSFASWIRNECA
jgi:hypothetical protein